MVTHLYIVNDFGFVDIGFIISVTGLKTKITEHFVLNSQPRLLCLLKADRSKYFHEIIIIIVSMIFI